MAYKTHRSKWTAYLDLISIAPHFPAPAHSRPSRPLSWLTPVAIARRLNRLKLICLTSPCFIDSRRLERLEGKQFYSFSSYTAKWGAGSRASCHQRFSNVAPSTEFHPHLTTIRITFKSKQHERLQAKSSMDPRLCVSLDHFLPLPRSKCPENR